jgi:hypothetical protein
MLESGGWNSRSETSSEDPSEKSGGTEVPNNIKSNSKHILPRIVNQLTLIRKKLKGVVEKR